MRFRNILIPVLVFFLSFFVYLHNISYSVYGGDVGDFVSAAFVGGVAHPPGYPLFVFLGFLLTRFHFWPSPAYAVGLISVLSGAIGVLFFFLSIRLLTKSTIISLVSSFILAFSYLFWFYNEIAEVFSLNNLFFILLFYISLKIYINRSLKLLPIFFFFLGLSLTNHQIIIFTFPSFFILITPVLLNAIKKRTLNIKMLLASLVLFLLGFAVYLYVPIASSHNPVINWDNVNSIQSFIHLLLRKDYGTFSAGIYITPSLLQRFVALKTYILEIIFQLTIPVITVCILGLLVSWNKNKTLYISLLTSFVISGPIFVFYAGFPLTGDFYFGIYERFFIISSIILLYFFPFGLLFLSRLFYKVTHRNPALLQMVFLIIPLMLFMYNFPKTNLSNIWIGDTLGKDAFAALPQNSLLFVTGDTLVFNTWYMHYVQGVRPDVQLLNLNSYVGSPYYKTLQKEYRKKHPGASRQVAIPRLVENLPKDTHVFSAQELQPGGKKKMLWIPYGLVFELIPTGITPSEDEFTKSTANVWSNLHYPLQINYLALGSATIGDIPGVYAHAMLVTGNFYLSEYKDKEKTLYWFKKAQQVDPTYDKTYTSLGIYYSLMDKNCHLAQENFNYAKNLNPIEPVNYLLLYSSYIICSKDYTTAKKIANEYQQQFKSPISKALKDVINPVGNQKKK